MCKAARRYIFCVVMILSLVVMLPRVGMGQYAGVSYYPFFPAVPFLFPVPYYGIPVAIPFPRMVPAPAPLTTYQRSPNATIIIPTGITAVGTAPGVFVIGGTTAVSPVVASASVTAPTVTTPPAPSPLLSILAVLYASALYDGPLSTANPLLFAYLTQLTL
ncbi:MAG: hypothetical protein ACMUIS_03800 [bacterium]